MHTPSPTSERRYHIVLNARSGSAEKEQCTSQSLQELFDLNGLNASVDADTDAPLATRIEAALASDAEIVVAAGGDGTVTALASALIGTAKTLAILPLGTANLLARDLVIPLVLPEAVAALGMMEPRRIDVGEVNGVVFLHKVVIGLVPGVAAGREHIRSRSDFTTKIAFLRFFLRRLARSKRIAVEIAVPDAPARCERVQALAVANNAYDEGLGRFFSRQRLDGGSLSLYILKHLSFGDVMRLTAGMVVGRWRDDEALSIEAVPEVTIRSRKPRLKVMIDGEVESMTVPLRFRIRPRALSILAPAAAQAENDVLPEAASH